MLSGTIDTQCQLRRRTILSGIVGAVCDPDAGTPTPIAILTAAGETPDRHATKALASATIHLAVTGAATAGPGLFVTATQTSVGACRATDWANSIAVN